MSGMQEYKEELGAFLTGLGANVRRLRLAKNPPCSQERLAHTTRLHRTEIGRIEQGTVEPRVTTLLILADGLGVSTDELLAGLSVPLQRKPSANGHTWPTQ